MTTILVIAGFIILSGIWAWGLGTMIRWGLGEQSELYYV